MCSNVFDVLQSTEGARPPQQDAVKSCMHLRPWWWAWGVNVCGRRVRYMGSPDLVGRLEVRTGCGKQAIFVGR